MAPLMGVPAAPALLMTTSLPSLPDRLTPTMAPALTVTGVAEATAVGDDEVSNTFNHCWLRPAVGARSSTCHTFTGLLPGYRPTVVMVALAGSTEVIAPA